MQWVWNKVPSVYAISDTYFQIRDRTASSVSRAYSAATTFATPELKVFCRSVLAAETTDESLSLCHLQRRHLVDNDPETEGDRKSRLLEWLILWHVLHMPHPAAITLATDVLASPEAQSELGVAWAAYMVLRHVPHTQHILLTNRVLRDLDRGGYLVVPSLLYLRSVLRHPDVAPLGPDVTAKLETLIRSLVTNLEGNHPWVLQHALLCLAALRDPPLARQTHEILSRLVTLCLQGNQRFFWATSFLTAYGHLPPGQIPAQETEHIVQCLLDTKFQHRTGATSTAVAAALGVYLQRHVQGSEGEMGLLLAALRVLYRVEFTCGMQRALLYYVTRSLCRLGSPHMGTDAVELLEKAMIRLVTDPSPDVQYCGQRCVAEWVSSQSKYLTWFRPRRFHYKASVLALPTLCKRKSAVRALVLRAMTCLDLSVRMEVSHVVLEFVRRESTGPLMALRALEPWAALRCPMTPTEAQGLAHLFTTRKVQPQAVDIALQVLGLKEETRNLLGLLYADVLRGLLSHDALLPFEIRDALLIRAEELFSDTALEVMKNSEPGDVTGGIDTALSFLDDFVMDAFTAGTGSSAMQRHTMAVDPFDCSMGTKLSDLFKRDEGTTGVLLRCCEEIHKCRVQTSCPEEEGWTTVTVFKEITELNTIVVVQVAAEICDDSANRGGESLRHLTLADVTFLGPSTMFVEGLIAKVPVTIAECLGEGLCSEEGLLVYPLGLRVPRVHLDLCDILRSYPMPLELVEHEWAATTTNCLPSRVTLSHRMVQRLHDGEGVLVFVVRRSAQRVLYCARMLGCSTLFLLLVSENQKKQTDGSTRTLFECICRYTKVEKNPWGPDVVQKLLTTLAL